MLFSPAISHTLFSPARRHQLPFPTGHTPFALLSCYTLSAIRSFKDQEGNGWVVNPFYPNQNRREFFKGAANGGVISSSEWPIMLSSALAATSAETSSEQFFRTSDSRTTTVKFNNYARGIGEIHGRQYYQWRIFVDEPAAQLISIEEVQYVLHRTFNEPFQISSRLRKNSLVHWAKPLESTIFVGISDMPQHGLFACPDRSKCDFRTSWRLF